MTNLGKIYKIKNLVNQKEYVGCTVSTLKKRFEEHIFRCTKSDSNTKLCNSVRKYGSDKFMIELIEECELSSIYEREKFYINEMKTFDSGLNSTIGGEGCLGYKHSKEIREKISKLIKEGKSHKNKTYDVIYGERSIEEKKNRQESVKKSWETMTEDDRNERVENIRKARQKNSKYGVELIKEVKEKLKNGIKVPQLIKEYPNMKSHILYDIKNNRRWKNI
jgi:group I intron endonuclease